MLTRPVSDTRGLLQPVAPVLSIRALYPYISMEMEISCGEKEVCAVTLGAWAHIPPTPGCLPLAEDS